MVEVTTTTFVLIAATIFIVGVLTGWILSLSQDGFTTKDLQMVVGVLVTIMWVVSIAAEIIIAAYTVSVLVHGIMGAVVGYLFSNEGLNITLGKGRDKK